MTKRLQAKYKFDRRIGENFWGHQKSPARKRGAGIGQHAQKTTFRRPSDYGTHLIAKQKLRFYYGNISEKQFRHTYEEAARRKGNTSTNLVGLLERRLDIIVYRLKFAPSVFAARQIINHRHILVNGKVVNIASYRLRPGDVVSVSEKAKSFEILLDASRREDLKTPDYLRVDHSKFVGEYLRVPQLEDVPYGVTMEPNLIVEFYSH